MAIARPGPNRSAVRLASVAPTSAPIAPTPSTRPSAALPRSRTWRMNSGRTVLRAMKNRLFTPERTVRNRR